MHKVKYSIPKLHWLQNVEKALDIAATFRTMVYFYRLRDDPYLVSVCMVMCMCV